MSLSGSRNGSDFATTRVTTGSMPPPTEFAGDFFGDYSALTADDVAHPVWMDTRDAGAVRLRLTAGHVHDAGHERRAAERPERDDAELGGAAAVAQRDSTSTSPGNRDSRSSRRSEIRRSVPSARVRVTPASRRSRR